MTFLNQHHSIYLVGLEKSGSFVEHAEQVSKKMQTEANVVAW